MNVFKHVRSLKNRFALYHIPQVLYYVIHIFVHNDQNVLFSVFVVVSSF